MKQMMVRLALTGIWMIALLFGVFSAASAGGWAVVTLDELPQNITVGTPYSLGMTIRQHGKTPWIRDEIRLEARHHVSGVKLSFTALPDQTPGHYQVELRFPQAGEWEWGVQSGLYPDMQPLPVLTVTGNGGAESAGAGQVNLGAGSLPGVAGMLVLFGLGVAAFLLLRKRVGLAAGLAAALVLLVAGILSYRLLSSPLKAQAAQPAGSIAATGAGDAVGKQLFLAKGCVVCHVNNRALDSSSAYSVEMGPDLTHLTLDSDYLRVFLKDPQALKPGTEMPNLGLSSVEIEALASFLANPKKE